jgi:hypothetical protein
LEGGSADRPELSELVILWDDLEAFRLAKNEREGSRLCFVFSFGDGGYWGIAVKFGVGGSTSIGESGPFVEPVLDREMTGRIVGSSLIDRGDDGEDLGEQGVRELNVDSGFKASALFDAGFEMPLLNDVALRSRAGS